MGVFKGSMSYVRFFAGKTDKNLSVYEKSIVSRAFIPLTPNADMSIGWVDAADPYGPNHSIPYNAYAFGDLVVLAYRKDTHSVPKHILREEVRKRLEKIKEEEGADKEFNRAFLKAVDAAVLNELRAKSLPKSKVIPLVWNTKTGEVKVFGTGTAVYENVIPLFERTFEVRADSAEYGPQTQVLGLSPRETKTLNGIDSVKFFENLIEAKDPAANETVKPNYAGMQTVGDQFLTWLYFSLRENGMQKLGEDLGFKESDGVETVDFAIGPKAKLSAVDGTGAKVALAGAGLDSNQELLQAVQRGALINLLSLDIAVSNRVYSLTLKKDGSIASLKLPDLFTDPDEDGEQLQPEAGKKKKKRPTLPLEDILVLRETCVEEVEKVIHGLFKEFVRERLTRDWSRTAASIQASLSRELNTVGKTSVRSHDELLTEIAASSIDQAKDAVEVLKSFGLVSMTTPNGEVIRVTPQS